MPTEKKAAPTNVVTGRARFSFVHVFEPHSFDSAPDKEQYSACVLIPKDDTKTLDKIQAAIVAARDEGKTSRWSGKIPPKLWNPLRDGDEEHPDDEAFIGHYFLNAKSNRKPNVVDKNLNAILDTTEFYSWCYGRADLAFYPFSAAGNNGIAVALNNVQKLADGEPLGGRRNAEDAFGDGYEDENGLDDLL